MWHYLKNIQGIRVTYLNNVFSKENVYHAYMERMILLRDLSKILLDTDLTIILLDYRNNFVRILKITSNAVKKF